MAKETIYIKKRNEDLWERIRKAGQSSWVNKKLDERREAEKRDPEWLEDEGRWTDAT